MFETEEDPVIWAGVFSVAPVVNRFVLYVPSNIMLETFAPTVLPKATPTWLEPVTLLET